MAKFLPLHLQPYWTKALQAMPPQVAANAKVVVGEKLTNSTVLITAALAWALLVVIKSLFTKKKNLPPAIPGLPVLGNILQLTEKKPHRTFTNWAQTYGPIFSVQVGALKQLVINSPELAKEVMVTKYDSVSKKSAPRAVNVLSREKCMVAMSDYGDEHRMLKKLMVTNLLSINPQKLNRPIREDALFTMVDSLFAEVQTFPDSSGVVDVKGYIKRALFSFAMFQTFGYVPEEVEVPELGITVTKWEIFDAFVTNPIKAAMTIDWRDLFPAFKWVPNKSLDDVLKAVEVKRTGIIRSLIREQRKRIQNSQSEPPRFYADILLREATHLTQKQLEQAIWEPIMETADTTLVTAEWIMFELAKNPDCQERLYKEIVDVVGTERMVTEDDLPKLEYLTAIIKETFRKYPAVPLLPARTVEKDITLGGYDVPKGWQVLINVYGIHNDPKTWPEPETWDPERVLGKTDLDMGFKNMTLMPFGAGKRICAGITLAMYIVPMQVVGFVQHFKWQLAPEELNISDKNLEDVVFVTTHKLHPLKCIATPRVSQRLP